MTKLGRIAMVALGATGITVLAGFASSDGFSSHHAFHQALRNSPDSTARAEIAEQFIDNRVESALDDLNASDEQREQVLDIKDDLFEQGKALHGTRHESRETLMAQWNSDEVNREAVHDLVDAHLADVQVFAHSVADAFADLHDILTPEQRSQVAEKAKEHHEARH